LKALDRVENKLQGRLTETQKILLTTDGSVTRVLEILTRKPVRVETLVRMTISADSRVAKWLNTSVGSSVNYRMVELINPRPKKILAVAKSWIAISRLERGIRKDLTSTDIPIGKIISKHKLDVRREMLNINLVHAEEDITKLIGVKKGSPLLSKTYNIVRNDAVLMRINELFPP